MSQVSAEGAKHSAKGETIILAISRSHQLGLVVSVDTTERITRTVGASVEDLLRRLLALRIVPRRH
jgi:hypothetical protein